MTTNIHWSSKEQEQLTPASLIETIANFFGEIDLDPCAEGIGTSIFNDANKHKWNVPATGHYTKADNGLPRCWNDRLNDRRTRTRVYCNPPYNDMIHWAKKAVTEVTEHSSMEILLLAPARPGSKWWRTLRDYPVCFLDKRLKFNGAETGAPFPSALFYLTNDNRFRYAFTQHFTDLGDIYERVRR